MEGVSRECHMYYTKFQQPYQVRPVLCDVAYYCISSCLFLPKDDITMNPAITEIL